MNKNDEKVFCVNCYYIDYHFESTCKKCGMDTLIYFDELKEYPNLYKDYLKHRGTKNE